MDAIPLSHPEWVRASGKNLKNLLWRKSARWATHIVTISNYSKHEIIKHFHVPEARISVIPLGVDARWFVSPPAAQLQQVKTRYALPERFFLFVGTLQPRKNLARLILAHKLLPQKLRREYPLLVVGRAGWGCEQELQALAHAEGDTMKWLNYVQDADLVTLVSQATALVFPSLHEGFGLPILEAFAAGVPVIASNTTSIPEVADDSALLVDPLSTAELAEAMELMLDAGTLPQQLREQGRARARTFSWDQTAAMTASVYAKVLESF
jgi:alpha-1,3-rhamnosyl/mannosyltransferase